MAPVQIIVVFPNMERREQGGKLGGGTPKAAVVAARVEAATGPQRVTLLVHYDVHGQD